MTRSGHGWVRLATATLLGLGLLWTTAGVTVAGGSAPPPGGTIYFFRVSDPQGAYAVSPDRTGLRALTCDGDRTHGGAPRRVVRVEQTAGMFVRLNWGALIQEPVARLVSTDESCGDVRILWEPGPGYLLESPAWSIDGSRVALEVARYDASGQMLDQGIWVGDVDPAHDALDTLHLAVRQAMIPADPQPAVAPDGVVAYYDLRPSLSWSADGRRVTYSRAADPAVNTSPFVLFVSDLGPAGTTAPGMERRVSVSGSATQLGAAFSPVPGDDSIAYTETTSRRACTHNDIFVVSAAGGTPRQITTSRNASNCQLGAPGWSPDGRWLAFPAASVSLSGIGIWYIASDGSGKSVAVVTGTGGVWYAAPRWRR